MSGILDKQCCFKVFLFTPRIQSNSTIILPKVKSSEVFGILDKSGKCKAYRSIGDNQKVQKLCSLSSLEVLNMIKNISVFPELYYILHSRILWRKK